MEAGRHAAFIWSAYGVAFVVAFGLVVRAVVQHRQWSRALVRLDGEQSGRDRRGGPHG